MLLEEIAKKYKNEVMQNEKHMQQRRISLEAEYRQHLRKYPDNSLVSNKLLVEELIKSIDTFKTALDARKEKLTISFDGSQQPTESAASITENFEVYATAWDASIASIHARNKLYIDSIDLSIMFMYKRWSPSEDEVKLFIKTLNLSTKLVRQEEVDPKESYEILSEIINNVLSHEKNSVNDVMWSRILLGLGMAIVFGSILVGVVLCAVSLVTLAPIAFFIVLGGLIVGGALTCVGGDFQQKYEDPKNKYSSHLLFFNNVTHLAREEKNENININESRKTA